MALVQNIQASIDLERPAAKRPAEKAHRFVILSEAKNLSLLACM
jgi:hypothetical protein